MVDLGTLGGTYSYAQALNNAGQVIGSSYLSGGEHAFLYSSGTGMVDLTLGGSNSYAQALNDAGQVIGYSYTSGNAAQHAFLYSDGAMTDLTSLLSSGFGWQLNQVLGLNNQGRITGTGYFDGQLHAFQLSPEQINAVTPEPTSLALLGIGGAGMLLARRRSRRSPQSTAI
jgi:probable HAF family extracellular repeat protein